METLQEFYSFFEAIPESKWITGSLTHGDTHCALGLLGCQSITFENLTLEAQVLTKLLAQSRAIPVTTPSGARGIVWQINDGSFFKEISSPKERILYALKLAMDSESIADFLDELVLSFLDEFDLEHGVTQQASPPVQQITGDEFNALIHDSIPLSISEFVGVKTSDDGFLATLLAANAEYVQTQADQTKQSNP